MAEPGKAPRLLALPSDPGDRTAAFGDPAEVVAYFEGNQHPNLTARGYLFGGGRNVRFQGGYSFLNRCPSPLSFTAHGSPRMW